MQIPSHANTQLLYRKRQPNPLHLFITIPSLNSPPFLISKFKEKFIQFNSIQFVLGLGLVNSIWWMRQWETHRKCRHFHSMPSMRWFKVHCARGTRRRDVSSEYSHITTAVSRNTYRLRTLLACNVNRHVSIHVPRYHSMSHSSWLTQFNSNEFKWIQKIEFSYYLINWLWF